MPVPVLVTGVATSWTAQSPATKTSPSFTVASGDVFVGLLGSEGNSTAVHAPMTISNGGGLTWTSRQASATNPSNLAAYGRAYTAQATSDLGSITIDITKASSSSASFGGAVCRFSNATGIGNSVLSRAAGAPTVNITTTQPNSAIAIINVDWNATDGASRVWRTGAGAVREISYYRDSSAYGLYVGVHTGVLNTGVYAVGLSAPGSQAFDIIAVEILGDNSAPPSSGTAHEVAFNSRFFNALVDALNKSGTSPISLINSFIQNNRGDIASNSSVNLSNKFQSDNGANLSIIGQSNIYTSLTQSNQINKNSIISVVNENKYQISADTLLTSAQLLSANILLRYGLDVLSVVSRAGSSSIALRKTISNHLNSSITARTQTNNLYSLTADLLSQGSHSVGFNLTQQLILNVAAQVSRSLIYNSILLLAGREHAGVGHGGSSDMSELVDAIATPAMMRNLSSDISLSSKLDPKANIAISALFNNSNIYRSDFSLLTEGSATLETLLTARFLSDFRAIVSRALNSTTFIQFLGREHSNVGHGGGSNILEPVHIGGDPSVLRNLDFELQSIFTDREIVNVAASVGMITRNPYIFTSDLSLLSQDDLAFNSIANLRTVFNSIVAQTVSSIITNRLFLDESLRKDSNLGVLLTNRFGLDEYLQKVSSLSFSSVGKLSVDSTRPIVSQSAVFLVSQQNTISSLGQMIRTISNNVTNTYSTNVSSELEGEVSIAFASENNYSIKFTPVVGHNMGVGIPTVTYLNADLTETVATQHDITSQLAKVFGVNFAANVNTSSGFRINNGFKCDVLGIRDLGVSFNSITTTQFRSAISRNLGLKVDVAQVFGKSDRVRVVYQFGFRVAGKTYVAISTEDPTTTRVLNPITFILEVPKELEFILKTYPNLEF